MTIKNLILTVLASFLTTITYSQIDAQGAVHQLADTFKRPAGDRDIEEVNVPYYKRVHRVIDSRQKMNMVVNWPKSRLFDIVHEAAKLGPDREGGIAVYSTDSLNLGKRVITDSVAKLGGAYYETTVPDPNDPTNEWGKDTSIFIPLEPRDVEKFRILEDWVFDKKYGDFRPHIIAIAPLYKRFAAGVDLGEAPLYWVMMKDLYPLLAKHPVYNPQNDSKPLSYEQWFKFRLFDSYVVGESNVYDLDFKYLDGLEDRPMDQLLEGTRVDEELFIREHDLWEY